jgi:hypothetical protein
VMADEGLRELQRLAQRPDRIGALI